MVKIETIFTHGDGELGIDDDANLYWNKKMVITKNKVTLDWWVSLSVIFASISTVVTAIYAVLSYYKK
jgi:1,4-dihydroxy-2-naphthoate octaprenyltransferase